MFSSHQQRLFFSPKIELNLNGLRKQPTHFQFGIWWGAWGTFGGLRVFVAPRSFEFSEDLFMRTTGIFRLSGD
jgi:hypothetical protein